MAWDLGAWWSLENSPTDLCAYVCTHMISRSGVPPNRFSLSHTCTCTCTPLGGPGGQGTLYCLSRAEDVVCQEHHPDRSCSGTQLVSLPFQGLPQPQGSPQSQDLSDTFQVREKIQDKLPVNHPGGFLEGVWGLSCQAFHASKGLDARGTWTEEEV